MKGLALIQTYSLLALRPLAPTLILAVASIDLNPTLKVGDFNQKKSHGWFSVVMPMCKLWISEVPHVQRRDYQQSKSASG